MKARFNRFIVPEPMTLEEFAKKHNLELVIDDRGGDSVHRYAAFLQGVEVREGQAGLLSACGTGGTPLFAVQRYCQKIAGETIVVHYSESTRDQPGIRVPEQLTPPDSIEEA